jgi:uncharacterized low-complexity protein
MTAHRTLNWLLATIIAATLSTAYLLDAPTEYQARIDAAQAAIDAEHTARQQARFEHAARKACGGGESAYELLADGSIQCFTHRGAKTILAKVAL